MAFFRRAGQAVAEYTKRLLSDYKMVAVDAAHDSYNHKLRTLVYGGLVGTIIYAVKSNPNEHDLSIKMANIRHDLGLLSDAVRSDKCAEAVERRTSLLNHGQIWRLNLALFSLLLRTDYNNECGLYSSQCKPIKPSLHEWYERIEDVGIFGKWIILEKEMNDYDINEKEWISSVASV